MFRIRSYTIATCARHWDISATCEITAEESPAYLLPCVIDVWAASADLHHVVLLLEFGHGGVFTRGVTASGHREARCEVSPHVTGYSETGYAAMII